jgi:hypothetical protein
MSIVAILLSMAVAVLVGFSSAASSGVFQTPAGGWGVDRPAPSPAPGPRPRGGLSGPASGG